MLSHSLTWLGVILVLDQFLKQTLSVRYFTGLILGSFGNGPVNKIRHFVLTILLFLLPKTFFNKTVNKIRNYVLSNSLTWSVIHLVLNQWFIQTLFVSYLTELIQGSFVNGPVNKIMHYVLAILLFLFTENSVNKQWIKSDTMC